MDPVQRYVDAWNSRVGAAVAATLTAAGTYTDPLTRGPLSGAALAGYVDGLVSAFPDLSLEVTGTVGDGDGTVALQWVMRGTNTGSMQGAPPTGLPIELPGMDIINVAGDGVERVVGYFDSAAVPRQLGFTVTVMPPSSGPVAFGGATRFRTSSTEVPAAISITALAARDEEEAEEVRARSQRILGEMAGSPGFLGWLGVETDLTLYTITAWSDPEAPAALMRGGAHTEAADRFWGPRFTAGGHTGVWTAHRLNSRWVRCTACGEMVVHGEAGTCRCGAALPPPPPFI